MPPSYVHESSDHGAEVADRNDAGREDRPSSVRITVIVQNRYTFEIRQVTGRQIKETAGIPADFALYRRAQGGNEPIADRSGDHFFARPSSKAS